ncbi:MAG TPA: TIGR03668 family PPOX class F420-dependent oxidoreductase [Jiangellales bacterium]|nr:TIGR03668 family PPOX class F420-dependent oxidoreductase [Jiangellales bacterium]
MDVQGARALFAAARRVCFASTGRDGQPHLVPVTFAMPIRDSVVFAVDHKPKTTTRLQRLANVRDNPRVSLLADGYDDADWTRLWWVRADATATVLDAGSPRWEVAVDALAGRYAQYQTHRPAGPVVWCTVERWVSWSAT